MDSCCHIAWSQAGGEGGRVVARAGDERQHVAGRGVEEDAGDALFGAAAAGHEILQTHIERGHHVGAGSPFDPRQFSDHPAEGVDLDLARPSGAAQDQILRFFDAALADTEIGEFEQRIAVELLLRNRRDIAHDMRGGLAEGVMPGQPLLDRDARQFGDRDLDPSHLVPAQIGANHDWHKGMLAADFADDAASVALADLDQLAERGQSLLDIAGLFGDEDEVIILPVVGQRRAEAIEDTSSRRRQKPQVDAVFVRQDAVAVRFEDLQLVHTAGQCCDQQRLPPGERRRAPRQHPLALRFTPHSCSADPRQLAGINVR